MAAKNLALGWVPVWEMGSRILTRNKLGLALSQELLRCPDLRQGQDSSYHADFVQDTDMQDKDTFFSSLYSSRGPLGLSPLIVNYNHSLLRGHNR